MKRHFYLLLTFLCFLVLTVQAAAQGMIVSVNPEKLLRGKEQTVTIRGANTSFQRGITQVNMGPGIEIRQQPVVINVEMLQVRVWVDPGAVTGLRDITVTTGAERIDQPAIMEVAEDQGVQSFLHVFPVQNLSPSDFDPRNQYSAPLIFQADVRNGSQPIKAKIQLIIVSQSSGTEVVKLIKDVNLQPDQYLQLDNRQFSQYIAAPDANFFQDARKTGSFPAGNYVFNLSVLSGGNIIAREEATVLIQNPINRPELMYPGNLFQTSAMQIDTRMPLFQWYSQGNSFDLAVYPVLPGQTTGEEVVLNRPIFIQKGIQGSSLIYPAAAKVLEDGKTYAWQVTSLTAGGRPLQSEVFWFTVKTVSPIEPGTAVSEIMVFPQQVKVKGGDSTRFRMVAFNENGDTLKVKGAKWKVIPASAGYITADGVFHASSLDHQAVAISASLGDIQDYSFVQVKGKPGPSGISAPAADAYGTWALLTPANGSDVRSGELLLTVGVEEDIEIRPGTIQVFLDDRLISTNIKVNGRIISMLYDLPLRRGSHKLEVKAKAKHRFSWLRTLSGTFVVGRPNATGLPGIDSTTVPVKRFAFSGNLTAEYKYYDVKGDNPEAVAQRMPQNYVRNVEFNAVTRVGKVSIPVRIYNTSDEQTYSPALMSRNYYQAGIVTRKFELTGGDMNPVFDRLILTGLRVQGVKAALNLPRFQMQVISGISQRAVEGSLLPATQYRDGIQQFDSSGRQLMPGQFKRNLNALRLSFGNRQEGSLTSFTILHGREDASSIRYGYRPQDNAAVGIDQQITTNQGRFRVNAGYAFSVTTQNNQPGASSKAEMDSANSESYYVNPVDYGSIFTLNPSTLRFSRASSAGYVLANLKMGPQNITGEYRYMGSAYQSFGNPYLRTDIESFMIQDIVSLWKRRIFILGRYTFQGNNMTKGLLATTSSHLTNGVLTFAPSPKLPVLQLNFFSQSRQTPELENSTTRFNDMTLNGSASLRYDFRTGAARHGLYVSYGMNDRKDKVIEYYSNSQQTYSAGITESLDSIGLSLDARYTSMYFSNAMLGTIPFSNMVDVRLRYDIKRLKSQVALGAYLNKVSRTAFGMASDRLNYYLTLSSRPVKGVTLDLEGGYGTFYYLPNPNGYAETYGVVRLRYDFSL